MVEFEVISSFFIFFGGGGTLYVTWLKKTNNGFESISQKKNLLKTDNQNFIIGKVYLCFK